MPLSNSPKALKRCRTTLTAQPGLEAPSRKGLIKGTVRADAISRISLGRLVEAASPAALQLQRAGSRPCVQARLLRPQPGRAVGSLDG